VQSLFIPVCDRRSSGSCRRLPSGIATPGIIESVLLGVTGIYGESIYPAGPEGGWTAGVTGAYHNHAGWWAGDAAAVSAFRRALQAQYHTIAAVNTAWGTAYQTFADHPGLSAGPGAQRPGAGRSVSNGISRR